MGTSAIELSSMATPRSNHHSFTETMIDKTSQSWARTARRRLRRHILWWNISTRRSSNQRSWTWRGAQTTAAEHGELIHGDVELGIQLSQLHPARTTAASPSSSKLMLSSYSMAWLTGGEEERADSFRLRRLSRLLQRFFRRKFYFIHDDVKGDEIDRTIINLWSCLFFAQLQLSLTNWVNTRF